MTGKKPEKRELKEISDRLKSHYKYSKGDILKILEETESVPATVFSTETKLKPLQALVTWLAQQGQNTKTIANKIKRSYRATWGAKTNTHITPKKTPYQIPLTAIKEELSILESVIKYLKEKHGLKFSEIANLLGKDQRTIWTVYNRAKKKEAGREKSEREILEEKLAEKLLEADEEEKEKALTPEESVPATVFSTETKLKPLQALVTWLAQQGQNTKTIANKIKRSYRATWGAKTNTHITPKKTPYQIPLKKFNRTLSVLETVVLHLKEEYQLSHSSIARMLGRDARTIWTVHRRAKTKNEEQ